MRILHVDYTKTERILFKLVAQSLKHGVENGYLPVDFGVSAKYTFRGPEEFVHIADSFDALVLNRETLTLRGRPKPDLGDYLAELQKQGYQGRIVVTTDRNPWIIAEEKENFPVISVTWFYKPGNYKTLIQSLTSNENLEFQK